MKFSSSPLLTDLYQFIMMQAYFEQSMEAEAVFEFFFRQLPKERNYLVACGLAQVVDYLENLHFSQDELDYLKDDNRFSSRFIERLADFRFTGDVHAMPEGTIFFADEPILRITAPLPQAQLVESRIINLLQFQTMIASKAIRMTRLLPDKTLIDYGLRRAHGQEAAVLAARASYLAGFSGTATVLAGKIFDIPTFGTMAHSFIQAHDSELDAFKNFAHSQPGNTTLLLDTYDTMGGVHKTVALASQLRSEGINIKGVRLDSGDMIKLAKEVRQVLDENGLPDVQIFASGNLDEYALAKFKFEKAPVDGYGVGSKLTTSADVPCFDCCYKLVEYDGRGRRKNSSNKATWPGRKQVYRHYNDRAMMCKDILALATEKSITGQPLLYKVMDSGKRCTDLPSPVVSQQYLRVQFTGMPESVEHQGDSYPVEISSGLQDYTAEVTARMARTS